MTRRGAATNDGRTLTIRVPLTLRKRGGRKQVIAPDGATRETPRLRIDNTMVKALARAHRWRKLIDTGRFQTVQDLAEAERINPSYIARVLRLTLLAPDIVEAILDGKQGPEVTLARMLEPIPLEWCAQMTLLR